MEIQNFEKLHKRKTLKFNRKNKKIASVQRKIRIKRHSVSLQKN